MVQKVKLQRHVISLSECKCTSKLSCPLRFVIEYPWTKALSYFFMFNIYWLVFSIEYVDCFPFCNSFVLFLISLVIKEIEIYTTNTENTIRKSE